MRRRETYNFAAEEEQKINASELDSAVATANLISIMDPKELGDEEVELISDATGASKEFVDEMADLCNDACEACNEGHKPEEVKQHFSAAAEELISAYVESCNFSAPEKMEADSPEEKVLQVAQLTTLVDDELLKEKPEEVAEVIADATNSDKIAVENIVETAKEHFSKGNTFYMDEEMVANFAIPWAAIGERFTTKGGMKKIAEEATKKVNSELAAGMKNSYREAKRAGFNAKEAAQWARANAPSGKSLLESQAAAVDQALASRGKKVALIGGGTLVAGGTGAVALKGKSNYANEEVVELEGVKEATVVPEPTTLVAEGSLKAGVSDTQPVEGTLQDPVKAAGMDPKEGDVVQDTTKAETALKVQNDLATVESVADVTPAQTNFGRQNLTGKEVTAGLKSLLGAHYIPNK